MVFDGLRGVGKYIYTSQTDEETYGSPILTSFNNNGFSLGSNGHVNLINDNYIAYQTLYTHIKWGLASQGKKYIEAYNPVTNEGMIMYEGSGVAGHQIPHSMGVEIDSCEIKNLSSTQEWSIHGFSSFGYMVYDVNEDNNINYLNSNSLYITQDIVNAQWNTSDQTYIMYYKCKSKTWTNGTYIGTGVAGNFIETKDANGVARKPMRVVIKAISTTGDWLVFDNKRNYMTTAVSLNTSSVESGAYLNDININGFTLSSTSVSNTVGVTYYYEVYFDTDEDGGGAEADLPSLNTQLQVSGGILSISNGIDANGANNEIKSITDGTLMPTGGWK